ncbi:MAG: AAA family ATPase [Gammaproteobacteria bacterium]|nr:AAA family ATPase [Gammaproteobacteria bacterium]
MSIIQKAVQSQSERRAEPKAPQAPAPEVAAPAPPASRPATIAAFSPLVENGFLQVDPADPASRSELRHLKRSVLQCAFGPLADGGTNVVMITSAMPGAGKTFLSANLAQALAMERDRTVLLIDADDTRATLSRALGLHGVPGFFDVMHDSNQSLDACLYASDIPGLDFVPAGGRFDDSLEILTSNRAQELIQRLSRENRSRLVVIDCPPLLGTPNAVALAALAGQILVVVEAGETSQQIIAQALELLNRDKPIGLVLNKIPRAPLLTMANGSYYYYAGPENE